MGRAAQELPWWVGVAPLLWMPVVAAGSYALLRLGLRGPARRHAEARGAHWTERARHAHVLMVGGVQLTAAAVTAAALFGAGLAGPLSALGTSPTAGLCALSALFGTVWGYRDAREGDQRGAGDRLRTIVVMAMTQAGALYSIASAPFMPAELDAPMVALWALGLAVLYSPLSGWVLRLAGVFADPPERLIHALERGSERAGRSTRGALLVRTSHANAFAFPIGRRVGVTQGALDVLDDAELDAILAHELGHLAEGPAIVGVRIAAGLAWTPLAFLVPLSARFGLIGVLASVGAAFGLHRAFLVLSRRLEHAADEHAVQPGGAPADGADDEAYVRALVALHRRNETPAVLSEASTHPSLHDRLLALGVTPEFERPEPPPSFFRPSTAGALVVAVVVLTSAVVFLRPALRESARSADAYLAAAALDGGDEEDLATLYALAEDSAERARYVELWASVSTGPHAALEAARVRAERGECAEARRWLSAGRERSPIGAVSESAREAVQRCASASAAP